MGVNGKEVDGGVSAPSAKTICNRLFCRRAGQKSWEPPESASTPKPEPDKPSRAKRRPIQLAVVGRIRKRTRSCFGLIIVFLLSR